MGVLGKAFEGRSYVRPGSRGKFRAKDQIPGDSVDLFTQLIIGQADNGVNCNDTNLPDDERYYIFYSFDEAKKVLGGGELLEAIMLADTPSSEDDFAPGPQRFIALNTRANVAASASIPSLKSGQSHTLTFPIPGPKGKKVRFRKTVATKQIEIGDNEGILTSPALEQKVLTISYSGDATSAILSVTGSALIVTLAGQNDGSLSLSVPFADYPTAIEAVDYINSIPFYTASMMSNATFLMSNLDHVEAEDAISVKSPAIATAYADLFAEKNWIESTGFAVFTTAATVKKPFANNTIFTYLTTGGTTGTEGVTAVKDAITFAKKIPAMYRNILASSLSDKVHFKTACFDMISPDGGKETIGGCGGDLSLSVDARREEARTLGVYWMNYGLEKFVYFGLDGNQKTYPGYMLSVLDNAISAANSPRHSPTWKALNILKSAENLIDSVRDASIRDGALVLTKNPVTGAWVIERSITTERKDNIILNEKNSVAVALTMVRELREGFNSRFIGRSTVDENAKVQGVTVADVKGYVEQRLQSFVEKGYLVGSSALGVDAFQKDFVVEVDGDTWYFRSLEGTVISPVNFIFYILSLDTLKGSA